MRFPQDPFRGSSPVRVRASVTDEKLMTERQRAEEQVRVIVEGLDRPTSALLYEAVEAAGITHLSKSEPDLGKVFRSTDR